MAHTTPHREAMVRALQGTRAHEEDTMVSITILWQDGGMTIVKAPQLGQAIDKADSMGATSVRDCHGGRLIKLSGEWVYIN